MQILSYKVVVVGSGAAALNAADCLYNLGVKDIAIVTEGFMSGTSRNTGSDKQTYYKLSVAGGVGDSPRTMAQSYFDGGCTDGDNALCEAAYSARCFYKLVELGIPFPKNEYGEYVGYITDHDAFGRATSAGPLTSKMMTEALSKQVFDKEIHVFNHRRVIKILSKDGSAKGILTIDDKGEISAFSAGSIIYSAGGEAGLYRASVYPESQIGGTGTALLSGCIGKNLTEWQYGIASVKFRWNLSGTYQQVLPRYITIDENGCEEELDISLDNIFLKGYQWPFDARKAKNSSLTDITVYRARQSKKRVFLDFTRNPSYLEPDFSNVSKECYDYLKNSDALFGTPIQRLKKMNHKAYDLYKNNGIDLEKEYLEIDVCAQHNNGGLSVDANWETNISHLFAVGEVAGTHGVYRPGGSALNAGQAGSLRAAEYISKNYRDTEPMTDVEFLATFKNDIDEIYDFIDKIEICDTSDWQKQREEMQTNMSLYGAHIRSLKGSEKLICDAKQRLENISSSKVSSKSELVHIFENLDLFICEYVYASAIADYIKNGGASRGSCLIEDSGNNTYYDKIQEVSLTQGGCSFSWRDVRPIPEADYWFERVWNKNN